MTFLMYIVISLIICYIYNVIIYIKEITMNAEILRGFTDAIILNILSVNDSYGYKISRHIIEKTNNQIDIKDATIYLAFKRMEKEKLITSYWSEDSSNARRKYYKITEEGKLYLSKKKKEWQNNRIILDKLLLGDINER